MKKIFLIYGIILLAAFINFAKAGDTFYTVVISSGKNVQAAQKLADDMIKKGFEANVINVTLNTGNTNRVCIGKSNTKAGAEDIQKKLKNAGYSNSWIAVMNGQAETKSVVKALPEKEVKLQTTTVTVKKVEKVKEVKEAEETEDEDVVDEITDALKPMAKTTTIVVEKSQPVTEKKKEKSYDIYVDKSVPVAEKKVVKETKKDNTAIPAPPDVDKLPLAVPKEFSGNRANYTADQKLDTNGYNVVTYNVTLVTDKGSVQEVKNIELYTKDRNTTIDTLEILSSNPNDVVIYHVGVGIEPINTATSTNILTSADDKQIVTYDVLTTSTDVTVSPSTITKYEFTTQPDPNIISNDVLITRLEPFPLKTNSTDSLVILKAAPDAQVIQLQPINSKEGDVVIHTMNVGTAQPENRSITTDHLSVSTISPAKSEISAKPVETEINPKMGSIIPGTNLSYNQFYTEIKKIFYALEKYSLASGTLLNEYIDPTYGTYLRFRNNNNVAFEKMIKPKDIYKNPQVKSNVLMFFQDMVKVRRQPAVIEPLPQYDCSLKHIPGLNLYLSSLEKGSKFSDETVKYLKTSGATLTNEEIGTILEANKTINAAFSIGSSELIKTVYFAVEGDKIYIRYIDMYDNCDKK